MLAFPTWPVRVDPVLTPRGTEAGESTCVALRINCKPSSIQLAIDVNASCVSYVLAPF